MKKCYLCKLEHKNITADLSINSTRINTKKYICADHAYKLGYITSYGYLTQKGERVNVQDLYPLISEVEF
jgi:hypothetical protein